MEGKLKKVKNLAASTKSTPPPLEPDKVWLTLERKYKVADYESMTVNLGAATSVELGEDVGTASKRLFRTLKAEFGEVLEVMRDSEGL